MTEYKFPKEYADEGEAWAMIARKHGLNTDIATAAHTDDEWVWVKDGGSEDSN